MAGAAAGSSAAAWQARKFAVEIWLGHVFITPAFRGARADLQALAHRSFHRFMCRDVETQGSVSAFAYQGTNSHAVLGAAHTSYLTAPQPWSWQRRRFWYSVPNYLLLQRFVGRQAQVLVMSCQLSAPALAYLADHQVRPAIQ